MDEQAKNDEKRVMIVREARKGKPGDLKAVTGMDGNGVIRTADPATVKLADLLDVNTSEPALEAFYKKMLAEVSKPVDLGVADVFVMTQSVFRKLLAIALDPEVLARFRVHPKEALTKMEQGEGPRYEPMDLTKIDREDMERKGIRMEELEPYLKAMSYGHKSYGLIEMNPEMEAGGMRVTTRGRVSLEEQQDGSLKVIPHYYHEKCDLDSPFYGVLLDDTVKRNIEETRHAGEVIELELTPGVKTPCFVSRDKWTNELVAMPVDQIEKRDVIKNAVLSPGEQLDFYSGRKVLLQGYLTRSGYMRDAYSTKRERGRARARISCFRAARLSADPAPRP